MIEQLPHHSEFDVPDLSGDTSVLPQSLPTLDTYDISPLTDLSLRGDGVALRVLEVTSTPTNGVSKEDAYMFATDQGDDRGR
jgi:hypothetical protein